MTQFLSRFAIAAAATLVASVAFTGAVIYLCYSVFLGLEILMSPPLAALATAFLLTALAMLVLLIGRGIVAALAARAKRRSDETIPIVADILKGLFGLEIATLAAKHPRTTIGIGLLLGLAFGMSPRLRRIVAALLKD